MLFILTDVSETNISLVGTLKGFPLGPCTFP